MTIDGDWKVVELLQKKPHETGGRFSTGYRIERDGETAFLKALDFSFAFNSSDPPRILQQLTEAYNFERDVLYKCKNRKMSRVVTPIADGSVVVDGFPPTGENRVYYIVFQFSSKGDIRRVKDSLTSFDLAFMLRALHNIAVGIQQLHSNGIAHQDVKPSNAIVFSDGTKIGDLGRATDVVIPFDNDDLKIPGDRNYAPPEQRYGFRITGGFEDRAAADMYLFGSLFYFFISGLSAAQAIQNRILSHKATLSLDFESDLPVLIIAFKETIEDLKTILVSNGLSMKDSDEVAKLVEWLCHPDPRLRGHPTNRTTGIRRFGWERFISRLSYLAKKAELHIQ